MKASSEALRELLASRQFCSAALFTFTLIDGTVLRYCLGDADVTADGHLYSAGGTTGPFFQRGKSYPNLVQRRGLDVSTLKFDVMPGSATVLGVPFMTAIWCGFFDGAEFSYQRAFMLTYGNTSVGTVLMFIGRVGEIEATRAAAAFTINSYLELLTQPFPRNLFQPGCVNTLYDQSCGVSPSALATDLIAYPGSTQQAIVVSGTGYGAGYYDLGKVLVTSGAAAGAARTVKSWDGTTLHLTAPLPAAPQFGDALTVWPGCDKTVSTCISRFSNGANFRGFPYVPSVETSI